MAEANPLATGAAWMADRSRLWRPRLPVNDWGLIHSDITYDVVPVWDGGFSVLPIILAASKLDAGASHDVGLDLADIRRS